MKKWMLALTLVVGIFTLSACGNGSNVATTSAGNVTKDDLYNYMKDKIGTQALQQLLFEKVLSKNYTVSSSEIDTKFNQIKAQYGSSFQSALAQSGFKNETDFKTSVKDQLLIEKAAQKDLTVTNQQLLDAYNSYQPDIQVRHILVSDLATAKQIKQKLDAGQNFADLAKKYSKDPGTAKNGGALGTWITYGSSGLDSSFEKAAFALKLNQISDPVKSQFGYHIIQKTAEKPKQTFNQMKTQLKSQIITSDLANDPNALSTIMTKEFKAANVTISDTTLKDALNPQSSLNSTTSPVGQ